MGKILFNFGGKSFFFQKRFNKYLPSIFISHPHGAMLGILEVVIVGKRRNVVAVVVIVVAFK